MLDLDAPDDEELRVRNQSSGEQLPENQSPGFVAESAGRELGLVGSLPTPRSKR